MVTILAVSPFEDDHASLRGMFGGSRWSVAQADSCRQALAFLRATPVSILVCERDLPDGDWKGVWDEIGAVLAC